MLSVFNQDYPNIEYIIIDGGSNDGTKEIIDTYKHKIFAYISETDQGMYGAINKGLKIATGDVVGLLHSDDELYNNQVISQIANTFQNFPETDGVYGNGIYVKKDCQEKIVRNRIGGEFSIRKIKNGWLPLHPTVYIKKSLLEKYGDYSLNFKIASDTEFLLRYLYKFQIRMSYINTYIVKMRMGGLSTSYYKAFEVLKEDCLIYKTHGINPLKAVFLKKLKALTQYIKR
jgi:glycosyltransferase involved in cell wall biosynthesis